MRARIVITLPHRSRGTWIRSDVDPGCVAQPEVCGGTRGWLGGACAMPSEFRQVSPYEQAPASPGLPVQPVGRSLNRACAGKKPA
jgi:hypothetical protein